MGYLQYIKYIGMYVIMYKVRNIKRKKVFFPIKIQTEIQCN